MTERNCSTCHHEWGRGSADYCDKCFDGGADRAPFPSMIVIYRRNESHD